MKRNLIILFFVILGLYSEVFAGRGCCSWHGGQAYCGDNGMWICNDGTQSPSCSCSSGYSTSNYYYNSYSSYTPPSCSYNEQLYNGICVTNEDACVLKYQGTIYDSSKDQCVCSNGGEYDSKKKDCINKDQSCNAKYPGTKYQEDTDKCVCRNGGEYNEEIKACYIPKAIKCKYSNGTKAKLGDVSAQGKICGIDGIWGCATNATWSSSLNKCISNGDFACQTAYGEFSVWDKTKTNGKYNCTCKKGYMVSEGKCTIK